MQKKGIIALLSMLVLAGCNKPEPIAEGPRKIGFALQYSRALVESAEDLRREEIKLFGSYILDGNSATQLDGERLYYDTELPGWDYTNTQYWISKALYHFCAVAPYTTPCTFSGEEGRVTIDDYESSSGGSDLLYAASTRDLAEVNDFSTVPLSFRHACSAVKFNIVNASNATVTDVRNIRLVGLQNRGDFTFGSNGSVAWVLDGSTVAADSQTFGGGCTLPNGGLTVNLDYKHSLYDYGSLLVLPQSVYKTDVTLHLEYIKQGDASYAIRDIKLGWLGGSTPTEWKAGQRYEYNLTITDNTITTEVRVVDWIDDYVDL